MAVILGVKIPDNERVEIALSRVHGIGRSTARDIVKSLKFPDKKLAKDLTSNDIVLVRSYIEQNSIVVEGDLRRQTRSNIRHFTDIKCYRGLRHRSNLPVHGQRTKTNARTKRGRRQTIAGKRKVTGGH